MKYDLEKRTTEFGKSVIYLSKCLKSDNVSRPLIGQLIRSATSIGANYREANESCSKKDFRNKIAIVKKEASETCHWLELVLVACPENQPKIDSLLKEVHELLLIFGTIYRSLKK